MQRIHPFWNSLLFKLFLSISLIIVPLIIILIINNYYAANVVRNQVYQSNKNMLNIYMRQIDRNLEGVGDYIYYLSKNRNLLYLEDNQATTYNEYLEAQLQLFQSISPQSNFFDTIDSIFIYSTLYKDLIYSKNYGESFNERQTISNEIKDMLRESSYKMQDDQWQIWVKEDKSYLIYIIKNYGVYIGARVNLEKLTFPFEHIDFGESGIALLATSEFEPLTQQSFIQQEKINLIPEPHTYTTSGKHERFLVMGEQSEKADFQLITLIPEQAILEKLPFMQRISTFFSVGALLFLLLFIFVMRKVFLVPINRIVSAMKKLRKGEFDTRIPISRSSTEFEMMNESFNDMSSRIKNLKIDVYEEKLNHQKAELKHLQLQINPHFFLNSLNIIYNLATVKDYKLIQQLSKSLANYFRFMFASNSYFVTIKEEIKHTDNYLKIQELRFPETFFYQLTVPKELENFNIPPLLIQSMVENSIKHAFNMDYPIEITVRIWEEEKGSGFINILIQDTGEGYPQEILEQLENDIAFIGEEGDRIGIWNVKRRLKLLYGKEAKIEFFNEDGKGATIRICLPKK